MFGVAVILGPREVDDEKTGVELDTGETVELAVDVVVDDVDVDVVDLVLVVDVVDVELEDAVVVEPDVDVGVAVTDTVDDDEPVVDVIHEVRLANIVVSWLNDNTSK